MYQDNSCSWRYGQPIYKEPCNEEWMHHSEDKCRKQKWCGDREWKCEPCDRWKKCCDPCDQWDSWHKCDENKKNNECEKCVRDVNICTSVNICQNGEANGGDANGGNGGDATGGSAAAASAQSEGEGDASATASVSVSQESKPYGDKEGADQALTPEVAAAQDTVVSGEGASAIGGAATGGDGGNGGDGGDASVSNSAAVTVENVVVICCDEKGSHPGLTLGTNNRKVNIKVDENGDTFVNGQKMDETKLEDGTKVFIFRNSEIKK